MKTGFTLGKFAPLHRGHQLLIETALAENDHVVAMIYDARETAVPLAVRAGWIHRLYPTVEVIEARDGPTLVGNTREIEALHEAYLLAALSGRRITSFYSSESYGAHVSRALGAIDRRVDPERRRFPVSGTAIRRNVAAHRQFIHPLVYRDLITKVVFLGAPSTGKTTLATALAKHYKTEWMPEYGREYWEQRHMNRRLTLEQLVEIAEEHRRREDELLLHANRYLFVDTDARTTRIFSLYYHGACDPRLERLADETANRYDYVFLCDGDIPYADTADRSGEANRALFQKWIREDLSHRSIPFATLRGSVEERMRRVSETLVQSDRFSSVV